jgi:4-amino-4-deoxy-L-arabinose transferase-like glycosyltransferase
MTGLHKRMPFGRPKLVALILVTCLVTRLLLFTTSRPWDPSNREKVILQFDAVGYHSLAVTLINHGQFALEEGGEPEALRTPGYPLYTGLFYAVFGEKPWVVLLSQIVLDGLSCLVLMALLNKALGSRAALCGGLFYALDPHLILYANHLLSEPLFLFFCISFFYSLWSAFFENNARRQVIYLACSALLLGLATLVRPVSLFLGLVFSVIVLFLMGEGIAGKLKRAGLFAAVFLLVLSPWVIRNQIIFGKWSFSSSGGYNLLVLQVAPFETERRGLQDKRVTQELLRSEASDMMREDGIDPAALRPYGFVPSRYYRELAIQYIRAYPGLFVEHYVSGIVHFFFELDTPDYARYLHIPVTEFYIKGQASFFALIRNWLRQKTASEIAIGAGIGLYLMTCYGAVTLGAINATNNRYNRVFLGCSALVALYFALITGAGGRARFRLPSIPFYLGFAGIGVTSLEQSTRRWIERLQQGRDGSEDK